MSETARGQSFAGGLLFYLHQPHSPERARAIVQTRLALREENFLWLARRAIYADRSSPYLALLRHVGCEYGDLQRLVQAEGLEGALATLYRRGVYLSHGELMGTEEVERGSLRIEAGFERLRSRVKVVPSEPREVGERAAPRPLYCAMFSGLSAHSVAMLTARQAVGWRHAVWSGPAPLSGTWLSRYVVAGRPPPVWFSRYDPRAPDLPLNSRRMARLVPGVGRLVGASVLSPVHAPFERPMPIVKWLRRELDAGNTPHLSTSVTLVMTVVQLAQESGVDLSGAQFTVSAEAITRARKQVITQAGGTPYPGYGARESGFIAYGCLNPSWPDELHLLSDCHALIAAANHRQHSPLHSDELLLTSLQRWWPIVLVNVSLGDRADFSSGACDCPLEALGWSTRLHTVRAFRKLKIGNQPVELTPILKLLEQTLPERFGGGPLSYQLVQLDADVTNAMVGLLLVVDPSVGEIDQSLVAGFAGQALAADLPYLAQYRDRSGWIRVERRKPYQTSSGKILQICHKSATSDALVAETLGM